MMNQLTRDKFYFEKKDFIRATKLLKNKIFKLLPIYEGSDMNNSNIRISDEEAYKNFSIYLDTFTIELKGYLKVSKYCEFYVEQRVIDYINDIVCFVVGLEDIGVGKKPIVKRVVFKACSMCEDILELVEEDAT